MNIHEAFEKAYYSVSKQALDYYNKGDMENYYIYMGIAAGILRAEVIEVAVRFDLEGVLEGLENG